MNKEIEPIRILLDHVLREGGKAERRYSGVLKEIREHIPSAYRPLRSGELEALLKQGTFDSLDKGQLLFLPALRSGDPIIPIASVAADFDRPLPDIRIRLALFSIDRSSSPTKLRAVGFRFEAPEGLGSHHYYHAQAILTLRKPQAGVETDPWRLPHTGWVPTTQPAFALDADGPATLILSLLLSLYGQDFIDELAEVRGARALQPYINQLRARDSKLDPHCWEIEVAGVRRYHAEWGDATDIETRLSAQPNTRIVRSLSRREFRAEQQRAPQNCDVRW